MIKRIFARSFAGAYRCNADNILRLLEPDHNARLLDLGCNDGSWTVQLAQKIGIQDMHGVEIVEERLEDAKRKGIQAKKGDLNNSLEYPDEYFDVIHANQVIEHLVDIDSFLSEIRRCLKTGGYAIISTENASSWHNIFASIMGWQIFSLTNVSGKALGIGNPLALHAGEKIDLDSWTHKTIFNYQGLIDITKVHGFGNIEVRGAGYHPLPAALGRADARHAHFITVKAHKA